MGVAFAKSRTVKDGIAPVTARAVASTSAEKSVARYGKEAHVLESWHKILKSLHGGIRRQAQQLPQLMLSHRGPHANSINRSNPFLTLISYEKRFKNRLAPTKP
jgi:hypothetical protein